MIISSRKGGFDPMTKEDDYRQNAAEMVELAQRANSSTDKVRLLAMAEAWLGLADRAHKRAGLHLHNMTEHPLIQRKLGHQPNTK